MSSEVCPFCGKTYKRLKSHLPHCKAAATSSKTPPTKQDVTVTQASPSSQLVAAAAKSTQTLAATLSPQSKKSKKKSVVSGAATQTPPSSSSLDSASLPPSIKKRKPKLSEQIKTPNSSIANSPTSAPSLPLSPAIPKPKKQRLRALIEAAKTEQVSKGPLAGTGSASNDSPSGSAPFVADPLRSRATAETGTKTDRDSVKDVALPAFLATDAKHKDAPRKKASRTKKAAQSLPTSEDTSRSLDSHFWAEDRGVEDLSVNKMFLTSGSGRPARITLQDVKGTLGRAHATRQSGRPSILSQIETADALSSDIGPVPLSTGGLAPTKTASDQLPCTSSQHAALQSVTGKSLMSKEVSLIPRHQLELTSPAAPLLSGQLSSQVSKATPPLRPVGTNERLKATGLLTISPSRTAFSSPLPAARVEALRAGDGWKSQLEARKLNTADKGTTGALTQQSLGQVRLRELPEWLAYKTPSHPREVVGMVQRGWQWYYKKYIDVKKGGAGGLGMLLAGYCVLGYIWNYPHIKRDRWRKHH